LHLVQILNLSKRTCYASDARLRGTCKGSLRGYGLGGYGLRKSQELRP
jgi:hypothetical protein